MMTIMSSGGRERNEQSGASERVSGAGERANGRVSGSVLQSVFLVALAHSVVGALFGTVSASPGIMMIRKGEDRTPLSSFLMESEIA